METIKVNIDWCDKNFGASVEDEKIEGCVVATHGTLEGVKKAISEALRFHVDGMVADGDQVPAWLSEGDYILEYHCTVAAILRSCERFTSLAAVARASGINQQLLSHYANGVKVPRTQQRQRIIDGLHLIGKEFISIQ